MTTKSQQADVKRLAAGVARAMRRAAKSARAEAWTHGTPVYIWKSREIVAAKP